MVAGGFVIVPVLSSLAYGAVRSAHVSAPFPVRHPPRPTALRHAPSVPARAPGIQTSKTPTPTPAGAGRAAGRHGTPKKRTRRPSPPASTRPAPTPHTDNQSYTLAGGQVVLSMAATSARLVSATPAPGYEVRTWHGPEWLRVDFMKDGHTSSLFATWNGHAPTVQLAEQ